MKFQTSLRLPRSLALVAGTVAALACGTASAQVQFTGFTNGCFGAGCTPESGAAPATDVLAGSGLTYANSTFNVMSAGGVAGLGATGMLLPANNIDNLGSWTLSGAPFVYDGSSFTLRVSFTAPPGTTPSSQLFTSTLIGTVNSTDNGGLSIDFNNTPVNFTFAAGAFTLRVDDVSLTPHAELTPVSSTGFITVTAIPEPETYALFLAGLGAVGFMARRRKS
jgi:hypothetical protein